MNESHLKLTVLMLTWRAAITQLLRHLGRAKSAISTSQGNVGLLQTPLQHFNSETLQLFDTLCSFSTLRTATASCHYPKVITASATKTQHVHTATRGIKQNYPTCTCVLLLLI